jgi:hypothetical protein
MISLFSIASEHNEQEKRRKVLMNQVNILRSHKDGAFIDLPVDETVPSRITIIIRGPKNNPYEGYTKSLLELSLLVL